MECLLVELDLMEHELTASAGGGIVLDALPCPLSRFVI